MLSQTDNSEHPTISQILRWITLAVHPLTLEELRAAIHIPSIAPINGDQAIRGTNLSASYVQDP
jgi:hypothetical protein